MAAPDKSPTVIRAFWDEGLNSVARHTIATTVLYTIGRGVGFLVPFFIAAWFGVGAETDALFFAYGIVIFVTHIFTIAVENVIVPFILEARRNNADMGRFMGRAMCVFGLTLSLVTGVFIFVLIKPVLSAITSFDAETLALTHRILIEISPLPVLSVWTSILSGTLNAFKRFSFPALSPAVRATVNLGIIFALRDTLGVHSIAIGYVIGELLRLVMLYIIVRRLNLFRLSFSFRLDARFKEFLVISSYQVIGIVAIGLNPVVDKIMASWLGEGSVSVLYYADMFYMIPVTFLTAGFLTVILSHWSESYYRSGYSTFRDDVRKTNRVALSVVLPVILVSMPFYHPMVNIFFGSGVITAKRLREIEIVWLCYMIGIVPVIMSQVYARGHLVIKNTKTLMRCALYAIFLNVLFNYLLMNLIGLPGIAISTSLVTWFIFLYLMISFNKKVKREEGCVELP